MGMSYRDTFIILMAFSVWIGHRFAKQITRLFKKLICILLGHQTWFAVDTETRHVYSSKMFCKRCGKVHSMYTRLKFKRGKFSKSILIEDIKPL